MTGASVSGKNVPVEPEGKFSTAHHGAKGNEEPTLTPHEFVSNLASQRSPEILFNLGLAFYKDKKWDQAFRAFEKSSHCLKNNPRLWYYMGVSVVYLNKDLQQAAGENNNSNMYYNKHGYSQPSFAKQNGTN